MDPNWAFKSIRNASCTGCSLGEKLGDLRCLVGVGPPDADLMMVGEAPGRREIEPDVRRPFAGASGKYLDKILENAGIDRSEVFITNALCCHPPYNRDPEPNEMKACHHFLMEQILQVRPKRILALGNFALKALVGKSGVAKYRGKTFILKQGDLNPIEVSVTYHPAFVRKNPSKYPILFTDLLKFKGVASSNIKKDYHLIHTIEEFRDMFLELRGLPEISFDFETESLDPYHGDKIICISLCSKPGRSFVVPMEPPWSNWDEKELEEVFRLIGALLSNPKTFVIAFNGIFDLKWAWTRKIPAKCDWDPMVASVLLDENLPHSLEANIQLYLEPKFTKLEPAGIANWDWEKIFPYSAGDADWTLRLAHALIPRLAAAPQSQILFDNLMMGVAGGVLPDLENTGIYVHEDKLIAAGKECREKEKVAHDSIKALVPSDFVLPVKSKKALKKGFNPGSPKQLGKLLFDHLGLDPGPLTSGGDWSTAESVLVDLKGEHPIIERIIEYRKYSKFLSTYIEPWTIQRDKNGFIHPHYHMKPVTGRLSSTDPNLQQAPRDPLIRNILGVPPGWNGLWYDYSQIEMRIAAHLSQDENLIQAYLDGVDIHTLNASLILGIPMDKVTKEQRKMAKAVGFGLIYGMGANGLRIYAKVKFELVMSASDAIFWRVGFFKRYPRLVDWHRKQRELVHRDHQVVSMIGRIRHLSNILSADHSIVAEAERQAINSPDQGLASDICLLSAVGVRKVLPPTEGKLIGLVHDAALYMIKDEFVEKWKPRILEIMENPPLHLFTDEKFSVPIVVDLDVSRHWG